MRDLRGAVPEFCGVLLGAVSHEGVAAARSKPARGGRQRRERRFLGSGGSVLRCSSRFRGEDSGSGGACLSAPGFCGRMLRGVGHVRQRRGTARPDVRVVSVVIS